MQDQQPTTNDSAGSLDQVVRPLLDYINKTPELLSLLYDMDLLPEQLKRGTQDFERMLLLTQAWQVRELRPNEKLSHRASGKEA